MAALANAAGLDRALTSAASAREAAAASIVAARLQVAPRNLNRAEWPVFEAWAKAKQLPALPARPATVAFFILDNVALGLSRLLAVLEAIAAVYEDAADPTLSPVVAAALQKVAPIPQPRSWPKAAVAQFVALPRSLQTYIAAHETKRDLEIRRCQNEAATARHALAQLKKEDTNVQDHPATPAAANA
jgi:hypothetical protein